MEAREATIKIIACPEGLDIPVGKRNAWIGAIMAAFGPVETIGRSLAKTRITEDPVEKLYYRVNSMHALAILKDRDPAVWQWYIHNTHVDGYYYLFNQECCEVLESHS